MSRRWRNGEGYSGRWVVLEVSSKVLLIMFDASAVEGFVLEVSPVEEILLKIFSVEGHSVGRCPVNRVVGPYWSLGSFPIEEVMLKVDFPCQSGGVGSFPCRWG